MNGIGSPETPPDIEKLKAANDFKGLIRALYYQFDEKVRMAAAGALEEWGSHRVVDFLLQELKQYSVTEKALESIVGALGMFEGGIDAAVDALFKDLTWDSSRVVIDEYYDTLDTARSTFEEESYWTAEAFRALGSPAVRSTLEALRNGVDVAQAGFILGAAKGDDVEVLLEAFKDSGWRVVKVALAEAFGYIGDQRAVELVIPLLEDSDDGVRRKAGEALKRLGWKPESAAEKALFYVARHEWRLAARLGKAAVEALERALRTPYVVHIYYSAGRISRVSEPHDQPRDGALKALLLIGEPATRVLIEALEYVDERGGGVEWGVVGINTYEIVKGLTAIGEPAVDGLLEAADRFYELSRWGAIEALCLIAKAGKITDRTREQRVIKFLVDVYLKEEDDDNVLYEVSHTLCSFEGGKVKPFITPALQNSSRNARKAAEMLEWWS